MKKRKDDNWSDWTGINPEFSPPFRETPDQTRARLRHYHHRAGTMGIFYDMYPDEAPRRSLDRGGHSR